MANLLWIISLSLLSIMVVLNLNLGAYDVASVYVIVALALFIPVQLLKSRSRKNDEQTALKEKSEIETEHKIKEPEENNNEIQFPKCIPIRREEDYHTHNIGTYGNRQQFMGFVVANLEKYSPDDWQRHKKWYAALYIFNKKGRLISHKIECFGNTADGESDVINKAQLQLDHWLGELPEKVFESIKVQRFSIEHDNVKFGLFTAEEIGSYDPDVDDEELGSYIHLVPNDLVFYPPWTGIYDT